MNRIDRRFQALKTAGRKALVPFVTAGDPSLEATVPVLQALVAAGADVLELGVPFSDPLADGLTNQLAAQRALESGMTMAKVCELVRRIREFSQVPIIFYTYYNLVFAHGVENYVRAAREAGVDGMLTLDLPPEESQEVAEACRKHGLQTVMIVAPTTPDSRIARIAAATTGFIYYVSREGVTGVRDQLAGNIPEMLGRIRKHTTLPVVVGFGISSRAQVAQVAAHADGVVVGSALVNCIKENLGSAEKIVARIGAVAADLSAGVKR